MNNKIVFSLKLYVDSMFFFYYSLISTLYHGINTRIVLTTIKNSLGFQMHVDLIHKYCMNMKLIKSTEIKKK